MVQTTSVEAAAAADEIVSATFDAGDLKALQWFLRRAVTLSREQVRTPWGRSVTGADCEALAGALQRVDDALGGSRRHGVDGAHAAVAQPAALTLRREVCEELVLFLEALPPPTRDDCQRIAEEDGRDYSEALLWPLSEAYTSVALIGVTLRASLHGGAPYEGPLDGALRLLRACQPAETELWFVGNQWQCSYREHADVLELSMNEAAWTSPARLEWRVPPAQVRRLSPDEHVLVIADLVLRDTFMGERCLRVEVRPRPLGLPVP